MTTFLDAVATIPDGDALVGEIDPAWTQGRTAFGGLLAALAARAARARVAPERRLRSLVADFVSPVEVGPVRIETRVLRAGRALTHMEARLSQGGDPRVVVVLAFAEDRATAIRWPGAPAPAAPSPEELPAFPYLEGVTPTFTKQFQYRSTEALPFTGSDVPRIGGWARLATPVPVDEAVLLALLDAWPAPVLPLLRAPAPASTVTWSVDVVGPIEGAPDAWWRFAADTLAAGDGHASVDGRLWDAGGRLVAVSRQLVAEFSAR